MQDHNETSIREPTVQWAERDGELARVEHRRSSAWIGSNCGFPQNRTAWILPQVPGHCQQKQKSGGWSEVHPPLAQEV